ncbi:unnamed protein product [Trichogramma brassicae]|uniref:Uncharacterized protein n=1 Tax=Trichogramma brassicae TaxID=86971 RepID=A0A6H5I7S6_9HYME|nr:unnamed protein product [Trichogramma brassicae]
MSTSKVFKKLKSLREKIKWDIEEDRNAFIWELEDLITGDWCCIKKLPNLQDIFQEGEIDQLLYDAVPNWSDVTENYSGEIFINFVIKSGYKDQPRLDETGKPISRHLTAIHRADKREHIPCLLKLFKIFTRFDVKYVDEATGMTHFHVACKNGCADVVEKFLEFGEDPNCLVEKTGDSPLHVVLAEGKKKIAELLLRSGADPNLANKDGATPLHVISDGCCQEPLVRILFEYSHEKYLPIRVNVLDKFGQAPLHYALTYAETDVAEALLRNGADPDLADADGLTPLHIICMRRNNGYDMAVPFFEIGNCTGRRVRHDVKDKKGRTPLQVAVTNLTPNKCFRPKDKTSLKLLYIHRARTHTAIKVRRRWKREYLTVHSIVDKKSLFSPLSGSKENVPPPNTIDRIEDRKTTLPANYQQPRPPKTVTFADDSATASVASKLEQPAVPSAPSSIASKSDKPVISSVESAPPSVASRSDNPVVSSVKSAPPSVASKSENPGFTWRYLPDQVILARQSNKYFWPAQITELSDRSMRVKFFASPEENRVITSDKDVRNFFKEEINSVTLSPDTPKNSFIDAVALAIHVAPQLDDLRLLWRIARPIMAQYKQQKQRARRIQFAEYHDGHEVYKNSSRNLRRAASSTYTKYSSSTETYRMKQHELVQSSVNEASINRIRTCLGNKTKISHYIRFLYLCENNRISRTLHQLHQDSARVTLAAMLAYKHDYMSRHRHDHPDHRRCQIACDVVAPVDTAVPALRRRRVLVLSLTYLLYDTLAAIYARGRSAPVPIRLRT